MVESNVEAEAPEVDPSGKFSQGASGMAFDLVEFLHNNRIDKREVDVEVRRFVASLCAGCIIASFDLSPAEIALAVREAKKML